MEEKETVIGSKRIKSSTWREGWWGGNNGLGNSKNLTGAQVLSFWTVLFVDQENLRWIFLTPLNLTF